jgi:hypothetical protein
MRKVSLILAVLLFAVPAWAEVLITCEVEDGVVTVSYDASSESKKVRAFALDITVDTGVITDVDANVAYDPNYGIYPGSIIIVDGEVTDKGSAVADPCDHPDTQPGSGTSGITVEMGALHDPPDDANGPPSSGVLLQFTISEPACVTIVENDTRGGVVMTDPNLDPDVNSPGCCWEQLDCLIGGNADFPPGSGSEYAAWVQWGKPNCWCYCRQCRGDADGFKTGPFWVAIPDLNLLAAGFSKTDAILATIPNGICADFDHKKTGPFRVAIPDLNILAAYFSKVAAQVPPCSMTTAITGPYNFWCDPAGCPAECPAM